MLKLLTPLPYAATIGGIETYFGTLCEVLAPLGWEVRGVTLPVSLARQKKPMPRYWKQVDVVGAPWWSVADFTAALQQTVTDWKPDGILSHGFEAPFFCGPFVPAGPRVIEVIHTSIPEEEDRLRRWHPYLDAVFSTSEKGTDLIGRALAGTTAASDGRAPLPVEQIYPGFVMPAAAAPGLSDASTPLKLVWVGRVRQTVKRVLDLVPLCKELNRLAVSYQLTVLGDGPELENLRQQLAADIAAGRVFLPGAIPAEQVAERLLDQQVYLCTSDCEGGPFALIEALASHLVSVVADIPGYCQELIRDGVNGYRAPLGAMEQFAARIAQLAANRAELQRMAANCRPTVDPAFTRAAFGANIDRIFRTALAKPSRRDFSRQREDQRECLSSRLAWMPAPVRRAMRWTALKLSCLQPMEV